MVTNSMDSVITEYCNLRAAYIHHMGTGCTCQYCKEIAGEWMWKKPRRKPRTMTIGEVKHG